MRLTWWVGSSWTGEPMTSLSLRWDMCVANRAFVVRELRHDLIPSSKFDPNWHYESRLARAKYT